METPATEPVTPEPQAPVEAPETAIDDAIADMLGGTPPEPRQETAEPPKGPTPLEPSLDPDRSMLDDSEPDPIAKSKETPTTIKALAENAGVRVQDLTFSLDNGDGTAREVSWSDAKAAIEKADKLESERLDFETAHTEQHNKLLNAQREFESVVAAIPPEQWPQGLAEQMQQQRLKGMEYQARMTLTAIPSWKDPTAMQADREMMADYLGEWGWNPTEVGAIDDHRALAFVRYHARLVKRVAELEKAGGTAHKPSKGTVKGRGNKLRGLKQQVSQGSITGDQAVHKWLKSIGV